MPCRKRKRRELGYSQGQGVSLWKWHLSRDHAEGRGRSGLPGVGRGEGVGSQVRGCLERSGQGAGPGRRAGLRVAGHAGREEGGNEAGQAQVALSLVEGSERGGRPAAATDYSGGRIRGGDTEPGRRCVLRDGDPSRPPLRPAPWSVRPPSSTSVLLRMPERPLQFSRHLMLHRQPPKCREGVSFLRDRCTAQRLADCRDAGKGTELAFENSAARGAQTAPGLGECATGGPACPGEP